MLILFNTSRDMIAEIETFQSAVFTKRYTRPGTMEIIIPENDPILAMIYENMYVYNSNLKKMYIVEYIKREMTQNDTKAVTVKGISIEGHWAQRIVHRIQEIKGANIQEAIRDLLNDHVLNPDDPKRRLDFFQFVDTTDARVTAVTIKTAIEGMSVMEAITRLLESKNLGYDIFYDLNTKKAYFQIVCGKNLYPGLTSKVHGPNLPNTVLLGVHSETINDLRSTVDLSQFKTRVYVNNYDSTHVFDRTFEEGIKLREGYLRTSYGNFGDDLAFTEPPIPPIPEFVPPELPPEIDVNPPAPEFKLKGLYVLTNQNRLLACAFYPGDIVPDIWFDVTPDGAPVLTTKGATVVNGTGELIISSADRKIVYRAYMSPGWLGTSYFTQADKLVEAKHWSINQDLNPEMEYHPEDNLFGGFAVDPFTRDVSGTLTSPWITSPTATHEYGHTLVKGTLDAVTIGGSYIVKGIYPGWGGVFPNVSLRRGMTVHSGLGIWFWISELSTSTGAQWTIKTPFLTTPDVKDLAWHTRPVPDSDVVIFGNDDGFVGLPRIYRSKDGFASGTFESWILPDGGNLGVGDWINFAPDGINAICRVHHGPIEGVNRIVFAEDDLANSSYTICTPKLKDTLANINYVVNAMFAGIGLEGENTWGVMTYQLPGHPGTKSSFYLTSKDDLSDMVEMTPLLDEFLRFGPFGTNESGEPNEWPVFSWPILG